MSQIPFVYVLLFALMVVAIFGWPPFMALTKREFSKAEKYTGFETGVRRQSNGIYQVTALTRMPHVRAEMVRWWFADYLNTTEQYKMWHPTDHVWYDWENKIPGKLIGASGLVHEYIGKELFKLRIQFVAPEELAENLPSLGPEDVAICARVGLIDQPFYGGFLCHIIRNTNYGAEMRSRFSLGVVSKRKGNKPVASFQGLIANTYLARKLSLRKSDAVALMTHAIEEMGYLADLLPELYKEETGQ